MKFATKAVRAGIKPDPTTGAIITPIYQTSTYVLEEVGRDKGFDYTRASNPTRQVLEENLAALESAKYGICFASGMSAVDAVVRMLSSGDHVISSDDVYGGVSRLFNRIMARFGLEFSYVNTSDAKAVEDAIRPNTKLIWVETPTNPSLKVADVDAIAKIGKERGIMTGVDSTFATPYLLRPIERGADIVMHSTTKYISGHNQLIGGFIGTSREDIAEQMKYFQKSIGAVPSPIDCYLTLLGVKTLPVRMEKHCENGMAVAKFLEEHEKVDRVVYPGLPSHPQHDIAKRQMTGGYSGMITCELKGDINAGVRLMNNVKLCSLAESLGATETMVTHPATMTHAEVPQDERERRGLRDSLVRISVGIEDAEDIIADLDQALATV